ncbi:hypothetical protein EJ06DRAFT_32281 [Trichodelitschia bisporula]|uniref:Uncharacterized protein n=1 Tax=Trichodelitschia bisporula TaxID=703511 RepID=A0A6G1IBH9_9PEZI|nr:hypothetical protein EJ06DRAFT_32281 [Trichodelitschia bisporula]
MLVITPELTNHRTADWAPSLPRANSYPLPRNPSLGETTAGHAPTTRERLGCTTSLPSSANPSAKPACFTGGTELPAERRMCLRPSWVRPSCRVHPSPYVTGRKRTVPCGWCWVWHDARGVGRAHTQRVERTSRIGDRCSRGQFDRSGFGRVGSGGVVRLAVELRGAGCVVLAMGGRAGVCFRRVPGKRREWPGVDSWDEVRDISVLVFAAFPKKGK